MPKSIHIDRVDKRFAGVHALKQISFDIEEGAFFGLLGPNGAGKSTLINTMAGLTRADSGRILVHDHDVVADYRKARRRLGVVPQELVYDPFFTVRELLGLQSGYFGLGRANRAWVDELLETLELTDKADSNLHALSGGMKRRVLIAQALVHKPSVVVLDEPTAGVDVDLRRALWRFSRQLHEQGHTIVLTTHYLEEAESLCDRIAILHSGSLLTLEDTRALLDRHPYRFLDVTLTREPGVLPEGLRPLVERHQGCNLVLKLDKRRDGIADVLDALRNGGLELQDLSIREPGLEEVFLELTGEEGKS